MPLAGGRNKRLLSVHWSSPGRVSSFPPFLCFSLAAFPSWRDRRLCRCSRAQRLPPTKRLTGHSARLARRSRRPPAFLTRLQLTPPPGLPARSCPWCLIFKPFVGQLSFILEGCRDRSLPSNNCLALSVKQVAVGVCLGLHTVQNHCVPECLPRNAASTLMLLILLLLWCRCRWL